LESTLLAMNDSASVWDWAHNDYLEGDHLACAPDGKGNLEYQQWCMYLRYVLGTWFLLLGTATAAISRSTWRVRKQLESVPNKPGFKNKAQYKRNTRQMKVIGTKQDRAMLGMLFGSVACAMQGAYGTMFASAVPAGVVSDCLFAFGYTSVGQAIFWSRQTSLLTRHVLSGADAEASATQPWWSVRNMVDVAERMLTPLAYWVMVVLVASGVCTRYQLVTVICASELVWGFALMHAMLFTRLSTITNVIKIHNNAGGKGAVVQRRQTAVSNMVLSLFVELVLTFFSAVGHPLIILAFDAHASSTRFLVVNSIAVTLTCLALTPFTVVQLKTQRGLKRKLQSVTTDERNGAAPSTATSSILQIQSSLPFQMPSRTDTASCSDV
jgi:hypothetical protein